MVRPWQSDPCPQAKRKKSSGANDLSFQTLIKLKTFFNRVQER
ncbi:hypothetical protein SynROS8604_00702 [Synechococcus sp. ROS8604]|nr:hypothetical protein SynROS8604_00702 [Synechococcus sp. ROS8604]